MIGVSRAEDDGRITGHGDKGSDAQTRKMESKEKLNCSIMMVS